MTDIYLVRHGQASFGKANYDKLSRLGEQQAQWLGEYFKQRDVVFDEVLSGDMVRHHETIQGIANGLQSLPDPSVTSDLNEFNFQGVVKAYLSVNPEDRVPEGASSAEYYRLLKKAMLAWSDNTLPDALVEETWQQFETRAGNALARLQESNAERILVVSSGGAIAMMLKHILGYSAPMVININLQVRNTSFTQCYANSRSIHLNNFNSVPHLDVMDKIHAITYS